MHAYRFAGSAVSVAFSERTQDGGIDRRIIGGAVAVSFLPVGEDVCDCDADVSAFGIAHGACQRLVRAVIGLGTGGCTAVDEVFDVAFGSPVAVLPVEGESVLRWGVYFCSINT